MDNMIFRSSGVRRSGLHGDNIRLEKSGFAIDDECLRMLRREAEVMLTENTVNKLYEMRLTAMAKAFKDQITDTNIPKVSFEDRFGLLVEQEWTSRKDNHLKRLIKQAKFAEPDACVEDIEYHTDRNLDQTQIARLSTCNFITERHNVLLLGATGSGKTYIACVLGMAAARSFLQVSGEICQTSGTAHRACNRPRERNISQDHTAVQKTGAAHSRRMAAVSAQGNRR